MPLDVAISPDERFLTLVATDGGNGIAFDQIFFGDPSLVAEGPSEPTTVATEVRQRLQKRQQTIEQKLATLSVGESVYAVVAQPTDVIHLLKARRP